MMSSSTSLYLTICCLLLVLHGRGVQSQQRIVGGQDASVGEFPYFVKINLCGGSLIAPGVVLTAAHCYEQAVIGDYVTVGPIDPRGLTMNARNVKIARMAYHPDFDNDGNIYDYMLLQLEEPLTATGNVVFSLNQDDFIPADGQDVTVMGFGLLIENRYGWPDRLQKVVVQAVPFDACNATYVENGDVLDEDIMLCAGVEGGGKDSCRGDSGAPLVIVNGNRHVQVGLASFGEGCGRAEFPGVYARVSGGMDWIQAIVCNCWGVSSSDICDGFSVASNIFECPFEPDPGCQDIPGYVDTVGDSCSWHEQNEYPGCGEYGDSKGGEGFEGLTSHDACCYCGGGFIPDPTVSPAPSPAYDPSRCQNFPNFVDVYSDRCSFYEANDVYGCPLHGTTKGLTQEDGETALEACCFCGGGVRPPTRSPTRRPTRRPTPAPTPAPTANSPVDVIDATPTAMPVAGDTPTKTPNENSSAPGIFKKFAFTHGLATIIVVAYPIMM